MRKLLSIVGAGLFALASWADTPVSLVFVTDDGSTHPIIAAGTNISFADGMLTAQNGETTVSLPLDKLDKMYFSGVQSTEMMSFTMSGKVNVFTLDGVHMGEFGSVAEACDALSPAVYVFKNEKSTIKMQVR